MAATVLRSTFGFVSKLFNRTDAAQSRTAEVKPRGKKRKQVESESENEDPHDGDNNLPRSAKRPRLFKGRPDSVPYSLDTASDTITLAFPHQPFGHTSKADRDRSLMPPPTTPFGQPQRPKEDDAISFNSMNMTKRRIADMDEDQIEAARRHAAAIRIPEDSGVWSDAEQDLYYHLGYRGFEPLLPQSWMIDFDTLPLSVFAHEASTDLPLIHSNRDNHFRAAHALRNLLEAGHDVRDRTHVSPGLRRERILERVVNRYLTWALADIGLRPRSDPDFLPTHIVLAHRKGRSTLETLQKMTIKLHRLADRHRQARTVYKSVEIDPSTTPFVDTHVDEEYKDCPTMIGLVIVSSVVVVVTLNHLGDHDQEHPTTIGLKETALKNSSTTFAQTQPGTLRTMINLDFSKSDQDVWNSLGVAIVAMSIRKEALKSNVPQILDDGWDAASFVTSRYGDDDMTSRLGDIDDPDL
ncbi:hypothetical protein B0A52_02052 [Exophiala mesophila]|uniref:Uncharacterized protein n=1 Tax=Exophiala mesophila TaxID=212818 RepID=A0A438NET1_EXOME|nr:hypothetical protein B0A52_02052 [Exophiala mesophila]